MGLVITKRKQWREKAKLWMLKVALENPPSRRLIHSLVQEDGGGRLRIEQFLESYSAGDTKVSGLGARSVLRPVRLAGNALGVPEPELRRALSYPSIRRTVVNMALTLDSIGLRIPQRFYAPLMVVWNLTYRCNLRCRHCYENAGPLRAGLGTGNELTLDEKLETVEQIAASHIPTISFSGGEPLIHPDFWPVAQRARDLGIYYSIASNGTLITKDVALRLKDAGCSYAGVSVDSPSPQEHDWFRGQEGAWQKAVDGLRNLVAADIPAVLAFTITRRNHRQLPEIFRLGEDLGVTKVMVYNFVPTGRGREMIAEDLTPEMREDALQLMYEYSVAGKSVCTTAPQLGRVCKEHHRPDLVPLAHTGTEASGRDLDVIADLVGGCGVGRAYCALQPDGRITPCVYMPDLTIGNVRESSILDVWGDSSLLESLADRSDLKGACGRCEHRAVCGGCRARAYAYFGDLKGPDPGCINNAEAFYEACAGEEPAVALAHSNTGA